MKVNLFDSTLPQNYSKGLLEDKYYDIAPEHTDKFAYTLFTATANLLSFAKSKDHPTTFEFYTVDNRFVAAAIVEFFENEDPNKPGNWSLVWTFYENDVPTNANRINIKDVDTHSYFRSVAGDKYGIRFVNTECLVNTMTYLLEQIKKWLDENAKEGEEVCVTQDSIFQARVVVENGEKVFALEPAGEIKMLIKEDASIEK